MSSDQDAKDKQTIRDFNVPCQQDARKACANKVVGRSYESADGPCQDQVKTESIQPRQHLKNQIRNRIRQYEDQIIYYRDEIRELEQFESTFFSLSEALQNALAPQIIK